MFARACPRRLLVMGTHAHGVGGKRTLFSLIRFLPPPPPLLLGFQVSILYVSLV